MRQIPTVLIIGSLLALGGCSQVVRQVFKGSGKSVARSFSRNVGNTASRGASQVARTAGRSVAKAAPVQVEKALIPLRASAAPASTFRSGLKVSGGELFGPHALAAVGDDVARPAFAADEIAFWDRYGRPAANIADEFPRTERVAREKAFEVVEEALVTVGEEALRTLADNALQELLQSAIEDAVSNEPACQYDRLTQTLKVAIETPGGERFNATVDTYRIAKLFRAKERRQQIRWN
jgi:hypothetical protein